MQVNSPANRQPASSPPGKVPSLSNSLTPRSAHHSQSSAVAPTKRNAACHSGGTSVTVVLIRICWKPQNRQQASSSTIASVSRWGLRSVIAAILAGGHCAPSGGSRAGRAPTGSRSFQLDTGVLDHFAPARHLFDQVLRHGFGARGGRFDAGAQERL